MAKFVGKLTMLAVAKAKKKGFYADGGCLYLQVKDSGAKSWLMRFMVNGKTQAMGLGSIHSVTLAEAREKATECRKLLSNGINPVDARKALQSKEQSQVARSMTFEQCGQAYIEAHKEGWSNPKHIYQWNQSLTTYAYPTLGKHPVQDIDIALVMKVLEPIWKKKTETATRLRGRIESILDWAIVREYRQGENPARWRGRLENLLPKPSKVQKVRHYPALPYKDIQDFMTVLKKESGLAAKALELAILTTTRTSETLKAKWTEFDLKQKIWTIPAERIKTRKTHRVPLSAPALAILKELNESNAGDYVFPGSKRNKPLSDMAMLMLLRRMKHDDITVHGFRSTFRDWAAEQTNHSREVAEMCLSLAIGDKVEAAYRRGDLFEKRQQLMDEWARYCYQPKAKGNVVKLRG